MTTTPTVWKTGFTVNAGTTTGAQFSPVTIGLAGDRTLTVWVDNNNNVDNDAGTDIIGQILDPKGNPAGAPFQLNLANFVDSETDPAIAALPDGGFVVAYEDNGTGAGDAAIRFHRFDAAGVSVASGTVASGNIGGVVNSNPTIAVLANGDYVIGFQQLSAGDTDVHARVFNGSTNVPGGVFATGQNSADVDANPDLAVLTSGNIVNAYEETDGATIGIEAQVQTPAGGLIRNVQIATAGTDPHVAALTGGGCVVVWQDATGSGDIRAEIRNNTGAVVTANFLVQGGTNSQNEPEIVALKDGGFFVVWDDDTASLLRGQRFSATGTAIGATMTIATGGAITDPELALASDGRILVSFSNQVGEIGQVILDPRDNVIDGTAVGETITSRIDGATVNGNGGNDTLLGMGAADILNGRGGDDTLDGGGAADTLRGGIGNDTYHVNTMRDVISETSGTDTAYASASYKLRAGVSVEFLRAETPSGTTAINLTGNELANIVIGNNGTNLLTGNAGNDRLDSRGGHDVLIGGAGVDRFAFTTRPTAANFDRIADMTTSDFIRLDRSFFIGIGTTLSAAEFRRNTTGLAQDGNDHVIYETDTGKLFYDRDGAGGVAAVQFAVLPNKPAITHLDFEMVV